MHGLNYLFILPFTILLNIFYSLDFTVLSCFVFALSPLLPSSASYTSPSPCHHFTSNCHLPSSGLLQYLPHWSLVSIYYAVARMIFLKHKAYSQDLEIRKWTYLGGHYSTYHTSPLKSKLHESKDIIVLLTPALYIPSITGSVEGPWDNLLN